MNMEIKREDISINSYLIGLHSFRKDHNYGNFKSNLINDVQSLFDSNFETIKLGGVDILKYGSENTFEIRLTPSTVIYQDNLSFEKMTDNSKKLLDIWIEHSPKVRLSLVGLVTQFKINIEPLKPTNQLRIKNQFFKDIKLGDKLKGVDFRFNYSVHKGGNEYNVHFSLDEKDYSYNGTVDFNLTTENRVSGLSKEKCDIVFSKAKEYFENDVINILNMKGK